MHHDEVLAFSPTPASLALRLQSHPAVYEPAEDSFLLAEALTTSCPCGPPAPAPAALPTTPTTVPARAAPTRISPTCTTPARPARAVAGLEGLRLLDLGCGGGLVGLWAALHGARVVGVDLNPHAVSLTAANAKALGIAPKVRTLEGDLFAGLPRPGSRPSHLPSPSSPSPLPSPLPSPSSPPPSPPSLPSAPPPRSPAGDPLPVDFCPPEIGPWRKPPSLRPDSPPPLSAAKPGPALGTAPAAALSPPPPPSQPSEAGNRTFDIIACNPPYLPADAQGRTARRLPGEDPEAARWQALALEAGPDGGQVVRRVLAEAGRWLQRPEEPEQRHGGTAAEFSPRAPPPSPQPQPHGLYLLVSSRTGLTEADWRGWRWEVVARQAVGPYEELRVVRAVVEGW